MHRNLSYETGIWWVPVVASLSLLAAPLQALAEPLTGTFSSPAAPGRVVNPMAVAYLDEEVPPGTVETIPLTSAADQPEQYYVSIALASPPRIRAAMARVAAASERPPQARALEDPLLSNNFYPISDQALQTAAGRAGNTMSVSQKVPLAAETVDKGRHR